MRLLILGGTTEASALARRLAGRARHRADAVARRPHAQPAAAADPVPCRRVRRRRRAVSAFWRERADRRGDRRDPSLRRADVAQCRRGLPGRGAFRCSCSPARPGAPGRRPLDRASPTSPPPSRALGEHAAARVPDHRRPAARRLRRARRSIATSSARSTAPDAIAALPSHALILARGPFAVDDETALMRDERVDVAGHQEQRRRGDRGETRGRARARHRRSIMVERPRRPSAGTGIRNARRDVAGLDRGSSRAAP